MISKKNIKTDKAPKAIGAYSQGVIYNNFIFTSGQIPINIKTGELISDIFEDQLYQVLKNLKNLVESEKSGLDKIIKLNVYLTDLNNFNLLNKVFLDFFNNDFPARSVVEVSRLPKDSQVEIDAICYR